MSVQREELLRLVAELPEEEVPAVLGRISAKPRGRIARRILGAFHDLASFCVTGDIKPCAIMKMPISAELIWA
jgi:hypothetical protein